MIMNALLILGQAGGDPEAEAAMAVVTLLGLVCVGFFSLIFYFIPTAIAVMRGHPNGAAIFILNLLLGWTFIGWVAALVWSFTAIHRGPPPGRYY
jgi:hypothetical protein